MDTYAQHTAASASAIKRFSHGRRFEFGRRLLDLQRNDRFLDFGSGDGYFLRIVADLHPALITAFEPPGGMVAELAQTCAELAPEANVQWTTDAASLEAGAYTKASIFEVLEHLPAQPAFTALAHIRRALAPSGRLVVSVPVEIGPVGLFKNLYRILKSEKHDGMNVANMTRAFFALPVDHAATDYIFSHVGFDFRKVRELIRASGFLIEEEHCSPFDAGGWLINSQVFFVCTKTG